MRLGRQVHVQPGSWVTKLTGRMGDKFGYRLVNCSLLQLHLGFKPFFFSCRSVTSLGRFAFVIGGVQRSRGPCQGRRSRPKGLAFTRISAERMG